jgi:hypothetical protein
MNEKLRMILIVFTLMVIIFSIFTVINQNQIKNIVKAEIGTDPIIAKIFVEEKTGIAPFTVNFSVLVLDPKGNVTYNWDFGDDAASNKINPIHTYQQNGTYTCFLTVTDEDGRESKDSMKINVKPNEAPTVTIFISHPTLIRQYVPILPQLADPWGGRKLKMLMDLSIIPSSLLEIDGDIHCEAQVYDPEGDEIISYTWVLQPPTLTQLSGATIRPTYKFEGKSVKFPLLYTYTNGQYDVTLIVEDSAGNNASVSVPFKIEKSRFESQTNYLIKTIILDMLINKFYEQYLSDDQKHIISDPLWKYVFGPINNTIFTILNLTILRILPEGIRNIAIGLYNGLWGFVENKFPKPLDDNKKTKSIDNKLLGSNKLKSYI